MTLPPLPFTLAPVAERERPTGRGFFALRYTPFVIRGALADHPLVRRLSGLDSAGVARSLAELIQSDVTFTEATDPNFGYKPGTLNWNFDFNTKKDIPFGDFAALLSTDADGKIRYMQSRPLTTLPELGALGTAQIFADEPPTALQTAWIGGGGQVVNLHYDADCNFICMFAGQKRVVLFPPEAMPFLHPGPIDKGFGATPSSLLRLLDPAHHDDPWLTRALPLATVVVLAPGDVLYVPPLYWHHVESFGLNVMMNRWAADDFSFEPVALLVHLGETMRFVDRVGGWRGALRDFYAHHLFRSPTPTRPLPAAITTAAKLHVARGRRLFAGSNWYVRSWLRQLYDVFAFEHEGAAMPSLPGERRAMAARLGKRQLIDARRVSRSPSSSLWRRTFLRPRLRKDVQK